MYPGNTPHCPSCSLIFFVWFLSLLLTFLGFICWPYHPWLAVCGYNITCFPIPQPLMFVIPCVHVSMSSLMEPLIRGLLVDNTCCFYVCQPVFLCMPDNLKMPIFPCQGCCFSIIHTMLPLPLVT